MDPSLLNPYGWLETTHCSSEAVLLPFSRFALSRTQRCPWGGTGRPNGRVQAFKAQDVGVVASRAAVGVGAGRGAGWIL